MKTVTYLLEAWNRGEPEALDRAAPLIYPELERLAASYLRRERPEHTLAPSGLVHEAFLRLVRQTGVQWQNRHHFLGIAAQMMRRVLVEHARGRLRLCRGSGAVHEELADGACLSPLDSGERSAVEEALRELGRVHPEAARIVELRFFGGFSEEEIAGALGLSVPTIKRRWRLARAWLHRYLTPAGEG